MIEEISTTTRLGNETGNETQCRYQDRVGDWMRACFPPSVIEDRLERAFRFLEESLELVQSMGCTEAQARDLAAYVFSRPVGDMAQEVGGVRVCLSALCNTVGIDETQAGETELVRVWTKIEKIRAKHASKPTNVLSALPGKVQP